MGGYRHLPLCRLKSVIVDRLACFFLNIEVVRQFSWMRVNEGERIKHQRFCLYHYGCWCGNVRCYNVRGDVRILCEPGSEDFFIYWQ
jgi:hypothetical protein